MMSLYGAMSSSIGFGDDVLGLFITYRLVVAAKAIVAIPVAIIEAVLWFSTHGCGITLVSVILPGFVV